MEKQLTIAVPSYNAAATIRRCLDSMLGLDPRLEVLVINDGSTDNTAEIVEGYRQRYPEQLQLLTKPNGGHGSGINMAIDHASGRYFKVVDADDWIVSDNLAGLLDTLEKSEADAVITGYETVNEGTGKRITYAADCRYAGQEIDVEQLLEVYDDIPSCCSFHGLFYRTGMYRGAGIRMSEGIFYEDHEYATVPFAAVERILILPILFYEYLLGSASQSVAFPNQVKRIGHIEQVVRDILQFRQERGPLSPARDDYFLRKLAVVVVSYFAVALIKNPDKKQGQQQADGFRRYLEEAEPELLRRISKKYKMLVLFRRLHLPAELYQGILDTKLYQRFRKLWIN